MASRRLRLKFGRSENAYVRIRWSMETLGFATPVPVSAFLPSSSTNADDNAERMTAAPTVDVAAMIELAAEVRMVEDFKNPHRVTAGLQSLLRRLKDSDPSQGDRDFDATEGEQNSGRICSLVRGFEFLATLLAVLIPGKTAEARHVDRERRKAQNLCLELLIYFCAKDAFVRKLIVEKEREPLIQFCFHSLPEPSLCPNVCRLIELIFMDMDFTFNLCSVPKLSEVLQRVEGDQLAAACKVLAVTITDMDTYYVERGEDAEFKLARDSSKELLLSVPDFLGKLLTHACDRRNFGGANQLTSWIDYVDDVITEELGRINFSLGNHRPIDDVADRAEYSAENLIGAVFERTQALYMLSLFLSGSNRSKAQRELTRLGLAKRICSTYDSIRDQSRMPGSPDQAVQIQLLRLVQFFCIGNTDSLHHFLTRSEYVEYCDIAAATAPCTMEDWTRDCLDSLWRNRMPPPAAAVSDPDLMCEGARGLITKMIGSFREEGDSSTLRFWICRALESFVRNASSRAAQVFLLRRDLLPLALDFNAAESHSVVIQASFDLTAVLVKFSREGVEALEDFCYDGRAGDSGVRFLIGSLLANIVSGNLLVRALILTADSFLGNMGFSEFAQTSPILDAFSRMADQVELVIKLVASVDPCCVTMENVSCINTFLMILVLQHRKDRLPDFLTTLANHPPVTVGGGHGDDADAAQILDTMQNLLLYWKLNCREVSAIASGDDLEKKTRIPLELWTETSELLLSGDDSSPRSISFYRNKSPDELRAISRKNIAEAQRYSQK